MKIGIWSDIACPFCYIGRRKLEEALAKFTHKDDVAVEFKAYQLDPNAEPYTGQSYYDNLATKFSSLEQAKKMAANIREHAKSVELDFHFDTMKPTNTLDAHRITKFAKEHGKELAITEELLRAHFSEAKDVGNHDTLSTIAEDVGLNKEEAYSTLRNENAYRDGVNSDIEEAKKLGITSVPTFIINRKYAISGAQPTVTFTNAMEQVWEEENKITPLQDLSSDSEDTCGPDGCSVPDQQ